MIYKDFSKRKVQKRIMKIADQEVDVSRIPTRVMLKLIELRDKEDELRTGGIETFMELVEIISMACRKNKKITVDWLIDNTDIELLLEIIAFIVEPLTKLVEFEPLKKPAKREEKKISKNSETPPKDQKQKSSKK